MSALHHELLLLGCLVKCVGYGNTRYASTNRAHEMYMFFGADFIMLMILSQVACLDDAKIFEQGQCAIDCRQADLRAISLCDSMNLLGIEMRVLFDDSQ